MPQHSKQTEAILLKANQKCAESGHRLTHKRASILGLLVEAEKPMSAYEVVSLYNQSQTQAIQPMSAYRILQFLQSEQLVHKLETQNKFVACSHISCSHSHRAPQFLVCHECQQVQEVYMPEEIVNGLALQAQQSGFALDQSKIELDGLCEQCQKSR